MFPISGRRLVDIAYQTRNPQLRRVTLAAQSLNPDAGISAYLEVGPELWSQIVLAPQWHYPKDLIDLLAPYVEPFADGTTFATMPSEPVSLVKHAHDCTELGVEVSGRYLVVPSFDRTVTTGFSHPSFDGWDLKVVRLQALRVSSWFAAVHTDPSNFWGLPNQQALNFLVIPYETELSDEQLAKAITVTRFGWSVLPIVSRGSETFLNEQRMLIKMQLVQEAAVSIKLPE